MIPVVESVHVLTAMSIVREAMAVVARNWRRLALWASFPMPLTLFMNYVSPSKLPQEAPWQQVVFHSLVMPVLIVWLWSPFIVRLNRLVVLGELPSLLYSLELFSVASFRVVTKYYSVVIQFILFYSLILAFPLAAIIASAPFTSSGKLDKSDFIVFAVVVSICFVWAAWLVSAKLCMFGPDVSVGGKSTLKRLGKRARPYRTLIIKISILILALPSLVYGVELAIYEYGMMSIPVDYKVAAAITTLLSFPINTVWGASLALVYKKISPAWPAMDAAEAAEQAASNTLQEGKPFSPPSKGTAGGERQPDDGSAHPGEGGADVGPGLK